METNAVPTCPTCGKDLDQGVRFCPDDGTPLTETASAGSTRTPTGQATKKLQLPLPVMLGNRYRLEEVRGGGGMAKVYRSVDVTLEREVAVKVINPELRVEPEFDARFQREARIASQLADPHIVVVHDFGLDATYGPFLVMEFLQGQSLREQLQSGPLPLKAVVQLSAQLMLALIHAHGKGIVHRDIKPDNIFLLNQSGVRLHVRVLDFGIARIYRGDAENHGETLTQPGAVLGTPRYMSPEQLAGQPVDARSDLFSAALVIYEALTGQLPYTSGQKLCEVCPEATAALQDLIDQCLKPNPNERPVSAVEVYLRLQELGKASGILLLPPGAIDKLVASRQSQEATVAYVPGGKQPMPWKRKLPLAVALALTLVLLAWAVFAVVKWLWPAGPPPAKEALVGLEVGDSRDKVVAQLGRPPDRKHHGDPWKLDTPDALGHVLKPADLGEEKERDSLDLLYWPKEQTCVVVGQDAVRAVIVFEHHAGTGRGARVGDSQKSLEERYPEEPEIDTFHPGDAAAGLVPLRGGSPFVWAAGPKPTVRSGPKWGKLYRYDRLGIGFELLTGKITGITLYPPVEPPAPRMVGD